MRAKGNALRDSVRQTGATHNLPQAGTHNPPVPESFNHYINPPDLPPSINFSSFIINTSLNQTLQPSHKQTTLKPTNPPNNQNGQDQQRRQLRL
jgi:hypothetical protein